MPEPLAVDWRGLLNSLGVPWIDKGRNTSRGNVNINCPLCGNDKGFHLRISEEYEIYNCWRDNRHSGTNFSFLLHELGCNRRDAARLLTDYFVRRARPARVAAPAPDVNPAWSRFLPLHTAPADHPVLAYFKTRGFDNPLAVAQNYDLRYAPNGRWAQRLLIPLIYDGAIRTWTGRSVQNYVEPRYLVNVIDDPGQLYIPRPVHDRLYVVEGPIDALKISAAFQGTGTGAVALCSKDLNAERILRIQQMGCKEVRLMLDNDAPLAQQFNMLKTLAASLRGVYVCRHRLPNSYKDAGEAAEKDLRELLG